MLKPPNKRKENNKPAIFKKKIFCLSISTPSNRIRKTNKLVFKISPKAWNTYDFYNYMFPNLQIVVWKYLYNQNHK